MNDATQENIPTSRATADLLFAAMPGIIRRVKGALRESAQSDGEAITYVQLHLLDVLNRLSTCNLTDLAARHQVTPSTMSRTIDVLVRRGWVDRRNDPADRRQVLLSVTDVGRAAHAQLVDQAVGLIAQLIDALDAQSRLQLYNGIDALHVLMGSGCEQTSLPGALAPGMLGETDTAREV